MTNASIQLLDLKFLKDTNNRSKKASDILATNVIMCLSLGTVVQTPKVSKHECFVYTCGQCEFTALRPDSLKRHLESLHEGNVIVINVIILLSTPTLLSSI